jgi:hypothetical protein
MADVVIVAVHFVLIHLWFVVCNVSVITVLLMTIAAYTSTVYGRSCSEPCLGGTPRWLEPPTRLKLSDVGAGMKTVLGRAALKTWLPVEI